MQRNCIIFFYFFLSSAIASDMNFTSKGKNPKAGNKHCLSNIFCYLVDFFPACSKNKSPPSREKKNIVNLSSRLKINNSSMVPWKRHKRPAEPTEQTTKSHETKIIVLKHNEWTNESRKSQPSTIVTGKD